MHHQPSLINRQVSPLRLGASVKGAAYRAGTSLLNRCRAKLLRAGWSGLLSALATLPATAQLPAGTPPAPRWHNETRTLRYHPEGTDFVITNGDRLFTRALYGTHSAFRVETGDRPEFALYMPGMGGNLQFGLLVNGQSKWLTAASTITARYRAGARRYTIQDPLLGSGRLLLEVLALADAEGLIVKARLEGTKVPVGLVWAFGGASGKKFSRDGDMGPDPESNFYLSPENCQGNRYTLGKNTFSLAYGAGLQVGQDGRYYVEDLKQPARTSPARMLVGVFPTAAVLKLGDAARRASPQAFYQSPADKAPALAGQLSAAANTDYYFAIHNPATKAAFGYAEAAQQFAQAEAARQAIAGRITLHTPDPYLNTLGGTLAIASDATWEAPSYMHGSIGWRMRLNGWRGAYTADALGWHDRAKTHLESYAKSQVTAPAHGPIIADTATHLSRSLEKLGVGMFTSGYISRDPNGERLRAHHYDMNLVYIDILLRHYAWTGDRAFLQQTWPVLQRHLAWETRNFDPDGDGLYDAYAAIWASDALQYSGGAVTHASAYNYFAFSKAAQIASLLGEDPAPYRSQAQKILAAMNAQLWMKDQGSFAEYKDALGNRLLHPAAALWTVYHSMDSETMDDFQAYQSLRYIDTQIPHIPVVATGLDDGGYYMLSTTNWMPYTWSLNNVALAESMHTALANWQGGRADEAFRLFKSEVLASMYLGGSPGNFVQISHYDAIRREAYRDFGDPIGMFSRALVEGLFGIVPDALHQKLTVRPGLPATWDYASFKTPDVAFDFKRSGQTDTYTLTPSFAQPLSLQLQVRAMGQVKSMIVNGKPGKWMNREAAVGQPMLEIAAPAATKYVVAITWEGARPVPPPAEQVYAPGSGLAQRFAGASVVRVNDPQGVLTGSTTTADGFSATVKAAPGSYTVFAQLRQGKLSWWLPVRLKVEQAVTLLAQPAGENSFRLQNHTTQPVTAAITVNGFTTSLTIAAGRASAPVVVPDQDLVTGTNTLAIKLADGTALAEPFYNWRATTTGPLEMVNLTGHFNDKVTQLFKNKYLTPRPPVTTLQLPWQGTGDWPHPLETHNLDDHGLRQAAGSKNTITLPQGIPFATPGTEGGANVLFTSQWDNYPREKAVPLTGRASHAWFLLAGSTNPMQSQLDNGALVVTYTDGTQATLLLHNPDTWWPIEEDYYTDGFAFALSRPRPPRIHLKTGAVVSGEASLATYNGREIEGGAATVLDLPLNPAKTLQSVTVKALANDVVVGLMAVTLRR